MKKVLITGKNSYVGNSFEKWLENYPGEYEVNKISVRDDSWEKHDFSNYDAILHVAGIAHVSTDPKMQNLYYKVNRDLTIKIAKKAKKDGVKQFIFMSSIIVYGESQKNRAIITEETIPTPSNFYGKSKLEAEKGIEALKSDSFKSVIVRPPMIYGKGSKGNYPKLAKVAKKLPIFPDVDNQRSMLYIDNLCEFLHLMIKNEESGLFFPQNKEFVKTSEMVQFIAKTHKKRIRLVRFLNPIINVMIGRSAIVNKMFGNLVYDKNLSKYKQNYQIRDLKRSLELSELECVKNNE